jgi:hypothetical protein
MMVAASIGALLWENWRLTRIEAAQRFGLGILGGSAALLLIGSGTSVAFWILFALNAFFYMSIAKLNGGKFMDGYKPGFPLYLLYTRPVPTSVFVGVAMAYDAISGVASYLVSAAILGYAFGQPFPLLGAAAVIVVVHLTYICIQWSTQSRVIQWIGSLVIGLPAFFLLKDRAGSPHEINFSFAEYAAMCVICVVSIVLTVAGVARQRRGDAIGTAPRAAKSGVYPVWLVDLFRFSCPTSSATRAQVWFELKSSGLPALAVGLGLGMLIFVLFAISIPVEVTRPFAIVSVVIAAPALLLLLGGNAFGIRRRQGRTYASAFELTQPSRTAQMAGLKVLLRTACLLVALTVVGVSIWASSSLLGSWGSWVVEGGKDAVPEFLKLRQEIGAALAGMMASAYVAQVVITSVAVVLLALAEQEEIASPLVVETVFAATGWTLVVAMVLATIYLGWSGVAERALTIRYAIGASMVSAAFAMAWLTVLHAAGVQFAGMAAAGVVGIMWPVLLPPVAGVFAPWALGRVRHA